VKIFENILLFLLMILYCFLLDFWTGLGSKIKIFSISMLEPIPKLKICFFGSRLLSEQSSFRS
jgi:hypothetical protein